MIREDDRLAESKNNIYQTINFREAVFLRKSGVIFLRTEWPTPQQAVFVFKTPPDNILSAWAKGDDDGLRATLDAADFFRDELHRRER